MPHSEIMKTPPSGGSRADARRNVAALLDVAVAVFAELGVDAPVRLIAKRAGVGIGTFYRHFPKRADLIVAVFRHEIDACADAAGPLQQSYPPGEALSRWIDRYTDLIVTKRGLGAALHSDEAAYDGLPAYFEGRMSPVLNCLLEAAVAAGEVKPGVAVRDLLWAVATLCGPTRVGDPALARRMIMLLLDGLHVSSFQKDCPVTQ